MHIGTHSLPCLSVYNSHLFSAEKSSENQDVYHAHNSLFYTWVPHYLINKCSKFVDKWSLVFNWKVRLDQKINIYFKSFINYPSSLIDNLSLNIIMAAKLGKTRWPWFDTNLTAFFFKCKFLLISMRTAPISMRKAWRFLSKHSQLQSNFQARQLSAQLWNGLLIVLAILDVIA